ncbi:DUF3899 domain-containing protein [Vagococcus sp.]|uniref:DUF3899 domain-containing protein n=1 Tax=Vagococcus sp. TaxID=1933889 RepID=UPI003F96394D
MKQLTKIGITLILALIAIPSFFLINQKEMTWTNFSNGYFLLALAFLIIGIGILVLSSGFFDLFQKQMKQLSFLRRKNQPKEYIPLSQVFEKKPIYWLVVGGTLLVISLLLLLF